MSRVLDLDDGDSRVAICFPYNKRIIAEVKSLPGREFDPGTKDWYVPLKHLEIVVRRLDDYHFKFSADLRRYCRANDIDIDNLAESEPDDVYLPVPPDSLSVSELNREAKIVLEKSLPDHLWLVGEVQGYDQRSNRGHAFFELVERFSEDASPSSKINVVAFSDSRQHIEQRLRDEAGGIELRDGLAVRLQGSVELYEKTGSYQFVATDVDPLYTQGDLHRKREKILKHLDELEIKEKNLSMPWPKCPLRIGLITSFESSAYRDFVNELERSDYGFELTTYDVNVQGDRTEKTVLRALEYFESRADSYDLIAVVRGGGARSELAYFDTESIGEAVCRHPTKVISGIGHQPDVCLLDYIADSQKTPTAAGKAIVEQVETYLDDVRQLGRDIIRETQRRVERGRQTLSRLGFQLQRKVSRRMNAEHRRLDDVTTTILATTRGHLRAGDQTIRQQRTRLERAVDSKLRRSSRQLEHLESRVRPQRLKRLLEGEQQKLRQLKRRLHRESRQYTENAKHHLELLSSRVEALDPERILEQGYVRARDGDSVVVSSQDVPEDRAIILEFADGDVPVIRTSDDNTDKRSDKS
jgi:exodeoxyribonuclease VII large subunit